MSRTNDPDAIAATLRRYRPFRDLIKKVGPPPLQRRSPVADRYAFVVRCIVHQQLAGTAAAAIDDRLVAACGGSVSTGAVSRLSDDEMAGLGLSGSKRAAIRNLTEHVVRGAIRFDRHAKLSDADVFAELVAVKGIGPWTVDMYLMNSLGRTDVWPSGDFGVRAGWSLLHEHEPMISAKQLETAADALVPHRSAVAWYCWEAIDVHRREKTAR